jgi:hypothetical protein
MERYEFVKIAQETMSQINQTIAAKGKEYSTGDAFSNFKDAAGGLSFHSKPEMVAWEFATKHFQSIKDIISGKVPASQATIDEKFGDAIVYLLLMKGMLTERQNAYQENLDKVIYHLKENP